MVWLPAVSYVLAFPLSGVPETPISPADSILTYILGYGVVGVAAVVLAWVLYKGTFVTSRSADKARDDAVSIARGDLLRENDRLLARAEKAEEQRDEAMKLAQTQLVPLLTSFTATAGALLPLLQDLVNMREELRSRGRER